MIFHQRLFVFFLLLQVSIAQAQSNTKVGNLRLVYLPIERVQSGGNIDVNLPTHFHHLRLFDSSTRFAPDEPSSFSSLVYTFWQKQINAFLFLESGVGFFRNHTKGDFLPAGEEAIHFGLGNSQVGPVIDFSGTYLWKKWSGGLGFQTGFGPHFSRWDSYNKVIDPEAWGVAGFGWTNTFMLFIETPNYWKRWSLRALMAYNYSLSSYRDFKVTDALGRTTEYTDLKFSSRGKRPVFSLAIAFDLLKDK